MYYHQNHFITADDASITELETLHHRFEFRNRVNPIHDPHGDSLTHEQLHSMLKRILFEPEGTILADSHCA